MTKNDERINAILAVLLEYTQKNFSRQIPISDRGDEVDALAAGLNTMAEELQAYIAERQRFEQQLEESRKQFRNLFEYAPFPMWVYDETTLQFLEVNNASVTHYGYSRKEFLSMHITDIRPVEEVPRLLKDIKHRTEGKQSSGGWIHRLKNGELRSVEIHSHRIDFHHRRAVLVIVHDVTERKRAEEQITKMNEELEQKVLERTEQLRDSEERYRIVAETATDGIVTIDETSTILFMNPAIEKIFGFRREELLGKDLTMLMPGYLRHLHKNSLNRYIRTHTKHIA
jgi:PAS domain S-box-containing protein